LAKDVNLGEQQLQALGQILLEGLLPGGGVVDRDRHPPSSLD
jgi:hypothetical protein